MGEGETAQIKPTVTEGLFSGKVFQNKCPIFFFLLLLLSSLLLSLLLLLLLLLLLQRFQENVSNMYKMKSLY